MEQGAPPRSERLRQLLRDLNFFIAALGALAVLLGFPIYLSIAPLLNAMLPYRVADVIAVPLVFVLIAAALAWRWWQHGLSPRQLDPARLVRFRRGHVLLAICNVSIVALFVWLLLPYDVLRRPAARTDLFYVQVFFTLCGVIPGLLMVSSAFDSRVK